MKDSKIVYVTSGANGIYGLNHLCRSGVSIDTVVTISDHVAAKNTVSGYADVTETTRRRGINLVTLDRYELKPGDLPEDEYDLLIVNGWNRLIRPNVLERFRWGGLGIHAGHPPIGLGRAPLPWNIIKGYRDIEVYVFRLTERADDGNILTSRTVEITPQDTVQTLYEKVMFAGARLFEEALHQFERGVPAGRPQNPAELIHYPKRTPADGGIDFSQPVEAVHNFIRAQTCPYPGAFAHVDGKKWHIWRAAPFDQFSFRDVERVPGRIVAALPSGLVVQTGTSPLWILEVTSGNQSIVPSSLDVLESHVGRRLLSEPGVTREEAA